jgi:hypothetical protein
VGQSQSWTYRSKPYLSQKKPSQKRAVGVVQGVGPEFKSQYCKKKKKGRQKQQDQEFKASLGYKVRPCLKLKRKSCCCPT